MNRSFDNCAAGIESVPVLFGATGLLRNHAAERMDRVAAVNGRLRGDRAGVAATGEQYGCTGEASEGERAELYHGLQYLMSRS
jgi:hypothetical protein